ncbi:MAG TPA: polysaccharide biosynthesis/export family protein [Stellaceae bacterium]|nr:polysaccharide biosynthesis/export family protein [Stellaceae bacterium]
MSSGNSPQDNRAPSPAGGGRSGWGCLAAGLVVCLALLLAGCTAKAPPLASGTVVAGRAPLVPEHTLTAGDEFEIRFPFAPEFNDRVTVGQDGTVAPKLIGGVVVGGLSVPEATAKLNALYARQIRYPDLSLTVRQYAPEVFYVDGEVKKPGLIRSALPLTLERAVAEAGGAKSGAQTGDILIIRRDPAGNVQAYKSPLAPGEGGADPILKSFDVVYVPQSPIGSINAFMATYVRNLPFAATYTIVPIAPAQLLTPKVTTPR